MRKTTEDYGLVWASARLAERSMRMLLELGRLNIPLSKLFPFFDMAGTLSLGKKER